MRTAITTTDVQKVFCLEEPALSTYAPINYLCTCLLTWCTICEAISFFFLQTGEPTGDK